MLGIVLNTIIPIITYPYVSRVLGVDSLGIYNFYASASTYLILLTNFGISIYGIREIGRSKDDLKQVSRIYLELTTISFIMVVISLCFVLYLIMFTSASKDTSIVCWFFISVFFTSIGADWVFVGLEKQKYLLLRNLIVKLISLICIFVFVTNKEDLLIYVVIIVLGTVLVSVCNIYSIFRFVDIYEYRFINIIRHIKPLFSIFVVDVSYRYLGLVDVILLGLWGTKWDVGIYSMALKVILLCIQLFNVLATTLLPRTAFYIKNSDFSLFEKLSKKSVQGLFFLCVPLTIIVFFGSDLIVSFLGGESFQDSVAVLKILSFTIIVAVLYNTIIFQILYPLGKVKSVIFVNIVGIIFNVCLNYMLIPEYHYIGIACAYLSTFILNLIFICIINRKVVCFLFNRKVMYYILVGLFIFTFNFIFAINIVPLMFLDIFLYGLLLYYLKDEFCMDTLQYIGNLKRYHLKK